MARTALMVHTARIVLTIRAGLLNESMSLRKPRLSAWLFYFFTLSHFHTSLYLHFYLSLHEKESPQKAKNDDNPEGVAKKKCIFCMAVWRVFTQFLLFGK